METRVCCDDMRVAIADDLIELGGRRGTVFKGKAYVTGTGGPVLRSVLVPIAFCPWCKAPQPSNLPVSPLRVERA